MNKKFFLFISILGTIFLVMMVARISSQGSVYPWQRPLIFTLFLLICFSGILAALSPKKCLKLFQKDHSVSKINEKNKMKFEGHHPTCENFENHVFHIKNQKYCAGCSGLITGSILAIIIILIYLSGFLRELGIMKSGIIIFTMGIILMGVTLYLPLLKNIENPINKFILNILFVFGASLGLIGMDMLNKNIALEFYYLILVLIWILTRISISDENHWRICGKCDIQGCDLKIINN